MKKRKLLVLVLLGIVFITLFNAVLYKEHMKKAIKIINIPSDLQMERFLEGGYLEEGDSPLEPSVPYVLMNEQCFYYSKKGKEVYYIPTVSFCSTNVSVLTGGICECHIYFKKVTVKNGKILQNSYLDGNEIKITVTLYSGQDSKKDAYIKDSAIQKNQEQVQRDFYREGEIYNIRYERTFPLRKLSQKEECYYIFNATLGASEIDLETMEHQGICNIIFSIGKQKIEKEFLFQYEIK